MKHSRKNIFHAIAPNLFSNHNNGQLNTELAQASGRITDITFQPVKFTSTNDMVAGMLIKSPFEKRNIDQRTVVVHEFKKEYLECK